MKKITKIPGNEHVLSNANKLKVAAYCRVSTSNEDQLISLQMQKVHYESYIKNNTLWSYVGLYYDEGISGTKKEKRPGLLSMIEDCQKGKIDHVITKSISRFARNTTDCLELVRKLLDLGISIYFEKENINTGDMESELMLTILSSLAENESTSISQNNKWAIQKRFQNGTYIITYPPYGYENRDGKMVIQEKQADVVRFIFNQILAGNSAHQVAMALEQEGIPTKRGGKWNSSTILGIVGNEKYTGDILFQKTYMDNKRNRRVNRGDVDQYYMKNHHDPIITHEIYNKAAQLINQRAKEKGITKGKKYNNRYPFTRKIICNECGTTFKRRVHGGREKYYAWCCTTHIKSIDQCAMQFLREEDLQVAFITMINKLVFGHSRILKPLLDSLKAANKVNRISRITELEDEIKQNQDNRNTLITLMTKGYLDPALFNKENNELLQSCDALQREKDTLNGTINDEFTQLQEVERLYKFIKKTEMLTSFSPDVFREYVDCIVVQTRTRVAFKLKCGLLLTEEV